MLRTISLTLIAVLSLGGASLSANDKEPAKTLDKSEVKQPSGKVINKSENKLETKKDVAAKTVKKFDKSADVKKPLHKEAEGQEKQPIAVISTDTDYYTSSPAQGRPADGTLKAGTKVRVLEKAGSYVRVAITIEAYVPGESFAPSDRKVGATKDPSGKQTDSQKEPASLKKFAGGKQAQVEKATAELEKAAAAKKEAAAKKQAAATQEDAVSQKKAYLKKLEQAKKEAQKKPSPE